MADGNVQMAGKRAVGRPRKARGAANSSDAADARWTVRGVPGNVRNIATAAIEAAKQKPLLSRIFGRQG
jgi:hypothetical protein